MVHEQDFFSADRKISEAQLQDAERVCRPWRRQRSCCGLPTACSAYLLCCRETPRKRYCQEHLKLMPGRHSRHDKNYRCFHIVI